MTSQKSEVAAFFCASTHLLVAMESRSYPKEETLDLFRVPADWLTELEGEGDE